MAYNENSVKVYKGLEGVIAKPTMYIGTLGKNAILHSLKEVVENSIDEYVTGNCDSIIVDIKEKKGKQLFTIADNGRGIPVGVHKKTKESTLTTILTTLHSGGKFDDKSYKTSRGTHGVGTSVVNALSNIFRVYTYRDKKWYYQEFKNGKPKVKIETIKSNKLIKSLNCKKGTIIQFVLSSNVTKNEKLDIKEIEKWLRDSANLNTKLKIRLIAKNYDETFYNKEGAPFFLKSIIKNYNCKAIGKPFILELENLTVAFQWTNFYQEDCITSFVSNAETKNGGTHVKGLIEAINISFRKFKLKKHKYEPIDLRLGLVGFINYKLSGAEFGGQTKEELVTIKAAKEVKELVQDKLIEFLKLNKSLTSNILDKATLLNKNKQKLKDAASKASKIMNNNTRSLLPGKLKTSHSKTPAHKKELFIVEGDSAAGTAVDARDPMFQEILALKGKPVNAGSSKLEKVLTNEEVLSILIAIGWTQSDIKKLAKGETPKIKYRIGKIMIMADADVDGKHIENLLCTLFLVLTPEVFKEKVYMVKTPLFQASYKDKKWFDDNLEKLNKKANKAALITRLKGLGELDYKYLTQFAFNIKTRTIVKIEPISGSKKIEYFRIVGKETEYRKELLGL